MGQWFLWHALALALVLRAEASRIEAHPGQLHGKARKACPRDTLRQALQMPLMDYAMRQALLCLSFSLTIPLSHSLFPSACLSYPFCFSFDLWQIIADMRATWQLGNALRGSFRTWKCRSAGTTTHSSLHNNNIERHTHTYTDYKLFWGVCRDMSNVIRVISEWETRLAAPWQADVHDIRQI